MYELYFKYILFLQIYSPKQLSVLRSLDLGTKLQGIEGKKIIETASHDSGLSIKQVSVSIIYEN